MSFTFYDPEAARNKRNERWRARNPGHDVVLCDMLDACVSWPQRRVLFATFAKDEQDGLMDEWCRRRTNRVAPVGSIVGPMQPPGFFGFYHESEGSTLYATHSGTATVLGQEDGTYTRYLMLHVPWQDQEGRRVVFAKASASCLVVCAGESR